MNTASHLAPHILHPFIKNILALAFAGLFAATAVAVPIGVTVNSVHLNDDASITDPNWSYNSQTGDLTFHGSGNFMVTGSNVAGKARIIIPNGVTNTVRFWNLTLRATNNNQCIFALETNACVSLILKGTNTLASGQNRAGIEVPASASLSITNSSADPADALTATGGNGGAGIGGGDGGASGTVTIHGGRVTATGGNGSAGIGGGAGGASGTVLINDGTVFAQGKGGTDIGPGANGVAAGSNTFAGGSIRLADNSIAPAPGNGTARVWCMTVTNLTPNAAIVVTALEPYGVNSLVADTNGCIYLWLPNNSYTFTAGDHGYEATIANADTTATLLQPPTPASNAYITFSSASAFTVKPQKQSWNGRLHYSTNATKWSPFGAAGATAADNGAGEYKLYLCGTSNTCITGSAQSGWTINAASGTVACSGNIESLLDYATVAGGGHPTMTNYCFAYLFKDCAALISAPSLPATNLADYCYFNLFNRCTGLIQAPALPAMRLTHRCYDGMFNGCTSLTQAPALPATTLTHACYGHMFYGCTGLTSAPALSAKTLTPDCYYKMFYNCTGLTSPPDLPAANLAEKCYYYMFSGCTGLTNAPVLPATNLAKTCYYAMFQGCTGITLYEDGSGPTWSIPSNAVEAADWNTDMLAGTGGGFTGNPAPGIAYYYAPGLPDAPLFPMNGTALVFSGSTLTLTIVGAESGFWYTLYSADDLDQEPWTQGESFRATGGELVFTQNLGAPTPPRRFFRVVAGAQAPEP